MAVIKVIEFMRIRPDPNNLADVDKLVLIFSYNRNEYRVTVPYNNEDLTNVTTLKTVLKNAVLKAISQPIVTKVTNLTDRIKGEYTISGI